jgi:hypothetical protein
LHRRCVGTAKMARESAAKTCLLVQDAPSRLALQKLIVIYLAEINNRLLLKCDYSYSSQHHNSSAQAKISSPTPCVDVSLPVLKTASNLFQALANPNLGIETTETDILDQVLSIIIENGEGVPSVSHTYFRTIDVWLPIIDREECMKRLETITADQNIELSCLLLCMYLVSQPPGISQAAPAMQMQTSTYFQAKALHSALVCTGNATMDIMQAGVLISLYEQGHGMIEAAQITMTSVIRLATKTKVSLRSNTDVRKTEFGRLWWGILILDRYSILFFFSTLKLTRIGT